MGGKALARIREALCESGAVAPVAPAPLFQGAAAPWDTVATSGPTASESAQASPVSNWAEISSRPRPIKENCDQELMMFPGADQP